jgi:ubiquinone/menaquinone biosynthesis C-methylase UbiE
MENRSAYRVLTTSEYYSCKGLTKRIVDRFYGCDHQGGTVKFYRLVCEQIAENALVLDVGAGPGNWTWEEYLRAPSFIKIGIDIDPRVRENTSLDFRVLGAAEQMPFSESSFNLVLADYVMEHLSDPAMACREIHRILKPGGFFFFRTNNLLHYTGVPSLVASDAVRKMVSTKIGIPDPYKAYYRFNTTRSIRRALEQAGFQRQDLTLDEEEPSYLMFHWFPLIAGIVYERAVNKLSMFQCLRANIFGRCQK